VTCRGRVDYSDGCARVADNGLLEAGMLEAWECMKEPIR
jgi:hypothetical protein